MDAFDAAFRRLIADQDCMRKVRRELRKRGGEGWAGRVVDAIEHAWTTAHDPQSSVTKAQRVRARNRCVSGARRLSRLLRAQGLDWSAVHFLPHSVGEQQIVLGAPGAPSLATVLEDYARALERRVEVEASERFMPRPGGKNAKRDAFVRVLAGLFEREFGMALYTTIAAITEAMFEDTSIDKPTVRNILRQRGG